MRQSGKRLLSMVIALAILMGAFLVYFQLIRPTLEDVQTARAEVYSREVFISTQESMVAQVKKAIENYRNEAEAQRLVSLALPNESEQSNVVRQLTALAESRGLAVQGISASAPTSQASKDRTKTTVRPIGIVNFNIKVAGNYESFRQFVQDMETNIRVMDIKSLAVEQVAEPTRDIYTFSLVVATYYQTQ